MELPIEREDVQAIMGACSRHIGSSTRLRAIFLPRTMKKKNPITPELQAQFGRNKRLLEERIAYHERKAAEEKKTA
jgi:hypothetical protein